MGILCHGCKHARVEQAMLNGKRVMILTGCDGVFDVKNGKQRCSGFEEYKGERYEQRGTMQGV